MSRTKTPAEFIRSYKPRGDSPSRRLACLLHDGAVACPGRFFDKPAIAKLVFGLGRTPAEDSEHVKKRLSAARNGGQTILAREFKREIVQDRLEGLRATVDDEDLLKTRHRQKRRRVQSTVASLHATDALIDPKKLSPAAAAEYQSATAPIRKLQAAALQLPQLLDGKRAPSSESPV
jgi:hypothetical protein